MNKTPILRQHRYTENGRNYVLTAFGGLHYIAGNPLPYFSLTGELRQVGTRDCDECGYIHERLLEVWPDISDLAALHLSDINGRPSHAVANGWYAMAGALGGAGERYHAGNQKSYGGRIDTSPEGCLKRFADHARVSMTTAEGLRNLLAPHIAEANADRKARYDAMLKEYGPQIEELPDYSPVARYISAKSEGDHDAKAIFDTWIASQYQRWQAEAKACIVKHHLVLYGAPWTGKQTELIKMVS